MSTNWWDDFTNNLSTDLAPLIALFGENPTKQYLSECLTLTDVFIFAMAPLGILTAITSAIRVAGTPGLRAFIGRAKEGGGQAEAELCSSTSREVCELYNNGGIARVFGRPKLLEIVYDKEATNKDFYQTSQKSLMNRPTAGLYTFKEYIEHLEENGRLGKEGEWKEEGVKPNGLANARDDQEQNEPTANPINFAPNPNLSLNVGIKQRPKWVFTTAALLGFILQSSVVVWAFVARYKLGFSRGSSEDTYALPMVSIGTILLCSGNGVCAWLVEKTTKERTFRRNTAAACDSKSQIYWIQPGIQYIGDQAFDSFMYSDITNPLSVYTTSWKDSISFHPAQIWIAITASVLGFVVQFLGMRACHSSVILAQLGATCVMSIVRAILRTDRLSNSDNVMGDSPDSYQGHELDWLALNFDNMDAFKRRNLDNLVIPASRQGEKREKPENKGNERLWRVVTFQKHVSSVSMAFYGNLEQEVEGPRVIFCDADTDDLECILAIFLVDGSSMQRWADFPEVWRRNIESGPGDEEGKPHEAAIAFFHRKRLSELTRALRWEDDELVSVREITESLARAIEVTTNLVFNTKDYKLKDGIQWINAHTLCWKLECSLSSSGAYKAAALVVDHRAPQDGKGLYLTMKRSVTNEGYFQSDWEANRSELESVLGLWVWSLRERMVDEPSRILGGTSTLDPYAMSGRKKGTELLGSFQINNWRARGDLGIREIVIKNRSQQHFHFFGWQNVSQTDVLDNSDFSVIALPNRNSLQRNCAQEIYSLFLRSLMNIVEDIGGETKVGDQDRSYRLSNSSIDKLQTAFTDSGLGNDDDSFGCILPVLYLQKKMPSRTVVNALVGSIGISELCIREKRWADAEKLLLWSISNVTSRLPAHLLAQQSSDSNLPLDINSSTRLYQDPLIVTIEDEQPNEATEEALKYINTWRLLVLELCECYSLANVGPVRVGASEKEQLFGYEGLLGLLEDSTVYNIAVAIPLLSLGQVCPGSVQKDSRYTLSLAEAVFHYVRGFKEIPSGDTADSRNLASRYDRLLKAFNDPVRDRYRKKAQAEQAANKFRALNYTVNAPASNSPSRLYRKNFSQAPELSDLHDGQLFRTIDFLNYRAESYIGTDAIKEVIHLAAQNGWYMVIKRFLGLFPTLVEATGEELRTPLSYAAESGDINTFDLLLERGANPNSTDKRGATPLIHATIHGRLGIVRRLISDGRADLEVLDAEEGPAPRLALQLGHDAIFKALMDSGKLSKHCISLSISGVDEPSSTSGPVTAMIERAVASSRLTVLEWIFKKDLVMDFGSSGPSILKRVTGSAAPNTQTLEFLLEKWQELPTERQFSLQEAFHNAVIHGRADMAELLLSLCPNSPFAPDVSLAGKVADLEGIVPPLKYVLPIAIAVEGDFTSLVKILLQYDSVKISVYGNCSYMRTNDLCYRTGVFESFAGSPTRPQAEASSSGSSLKQSQLQSYYPTTLFCRAVIVAGKSLDFETLKLLLQEIKGDRKRLTSLMRDCPCGKTPLWKAACFRNKKLFEFILSYNLDSLSGINMRLQSTQRGGFQCYIGMHDHDLLELRPRSTPALELRASPAYTANRQWQPSRSADESKALALAYELTGQSEFLMFEPITANPYSEAIPSIGLKVLDRLWFCQIDSLFWISYIRGDYDILIRIIHSPNFNPNERMEYDTEPFSISKLKNPAPYLLLQATIKNESWLVAELLKTGTLDLNVHDDDGNTALMLCSLIDDHHNRTEILKQLKEAESGAYKREGVSRGDVGGAGDIEEPWKREEAEEVMVGTDEVGIATEDENGEGTEKGDIEDQWMMEEADFMVETDEDSGITTEEEDEDEEEMELEGSEVEKIETEEE